MSVSYCDRTLKDTASQSWYPIPVFKLCGHFVLYTTTHRYELRLDRTTGFRPYFLHRPSQDNKELLNSSPRYHLFVCGWTDHTHEEIVRVFHEAITCFGEYNRITNNCRTFLQLGCAYILRTPSAWHENMLMVETGHLFLIPRSTNEEAINLGVSEFSRLLLWDKCSFCMGRN
ncbi:hypothetical protein BT96DRAFT_724445 [Gymnopus androsaceus JB14]|uniref:PPPDE domain-containing protein n=1 Tax=Gymnopus androsaceus JB14 TaxID=1447944 RepID=A0A6A4GE87_9AGAR|nr:hypothetical protein BT96DRAFT_724445 [Gymnopus androsaceus JB14]